MRILLNYLFALFLLFLTWSMGNAQTQLTHTPNSSPKGMVSQEIGVTEISVTYFRPAVKGRDLWGKLVPENTVWRAGANDNTVFHFSTDVLIAGQPLAAGTYGFHLIPKSGTWTAIFSHNSTSWGSFSYNNAEDALRVEVMPENSEHHQEFLSYNFTDLTPSTAVCALSWGQKVIPIPMEVNLEKTVLVRLKNDLRYKPGWSWTGYNEAARYCLQNEVDLKQGLQWATRSVFMSPTPQNLLTKALLTGKIKAGDDQAKALEVSLSTLEEDLGKHPVTWKEWHSAANYAQQQKASDKAMAWLNQSIQMSANMTNMMTKVAMLDAKGETKAANQLKQKALSKGSNAQLNNYGYQLLFAGKTADAVEVFKMNAERHPEDPNVWDSLGEGYVSNGQKAEAIQAFKKSLSLNPPPNVRANSMKFLKQLGVKIDEER